MGRKKRLNDTDSRVDDVVRPRLAASRHPLHFEDLSPDNFERLCMWLVKAEGYKNPEHVGLLGGDDGCDVKAWETTRRGTELWWFQCKRRAKITRKDLIGEVDKIHAHVEASAASKLAGIVFVVAAPVSAATRSCVDRRCAALGYGCRWWAKTELDMMVKNHPRILAEFFGLGLLAREIAPERILPLRQLPSAPPDFTGRERELRLLSESFAASKTGAVISCVQGMAGVGKTALALVAANRMAREYPGGQIFLDLQGASEQQPLTSGEAMARVIHAFEPALTLPEEVGQLASIYRSVLHDKRVLLFFDNVLDADQVRPLIPPETCLTLITSRQRFHLPGLAVVDLDVLPQRHACELLRRICRRIGHVDDLIAELCGCLPLALRAAASLLVVRQDLSASEYTRLLKDERSRLRQLGREGVELTVEASLALSYELLPKKLQQPFCMLSVLRGMIHVDAAATVWQLKSETSRDRLGALLQLSLLDWDEKTHRYRLHELVRLFADARLTASNRHQAQLRHAVCFSFVLAHAQELYVKGGQSMIEGLMLFDQEWANIDASHEWIVANAHKDEKLEGFPSLYASACAEFFPIRLHPQRRIAWLEPALTAAKALRDAEAEGAHFTGLGIAYYDWGDPRKAMKYHKRVLTLARKTGNRRAEAGALCNLGNCSFLLGDRKKAIRYHERSLHIACELKDRRGQGKSLGNLGNAYSRMGDKGRALECYRRQLDIAREIGDREQEGNARNGMGVTFSNGGEIERAIDCYEKGLVIGRELGDRGSEASALSGLAGAQFALGNASRAIDLCRQALDIERRIGDRRGEAISLNNLAAYHDRLKNTEQATARLRDALVAFRDIADRKSEADVLARLGKLFLERADCQTALSYLRDALPIFHEMGNRREEANCMANLGRIYSLLGQNDLAVEFLRQAADVFHQLEDKGSEGCALCNLSERYARTNRAELAIECGHRALEILRQAGDKHAECACLSNLANAHRHLGDADKATEYCEEQLHLARDIADRLQEANALCGAGVLWAERGDRLKAVASYEAAAELHGEIGDCANKGNDLLNLAKELRMLGRQQDVVRNLEKAIEAFEAAGSPRVVEARQLLALVQ